MKDIVLVTGCSSGIGRAICTKLNSLKYTVIAGVRREKDIQSLSHLKSCYPILLDITKSEDIQKAVQYITDKQKEDQRISLVNNAGVAVAGPIESLPMKDWRKQFDVNFFGTVELTKELCPKIRKTKGCVINIGSVSGLVTSPFLAPYAASKYALEAFSDALRRETYGMGVAVSLIEPGPIQTPIWEKGLNSKEKLEAGIPENIREIYKQKLHKFTLMVEKSAGDAIPVENVSNCVAMILSSKKPKSRYVIASTSSKWGLYLTKWLPDHWIDSLIG